MSFNCMNSRRSQAPTQPNNRAEQVEPVARVSGTHTPGATTERTYLPVVFGDLEVNCLIDTGCEVTLFPEGLVDQEIIKPARRRVLAVNGSEIAVLGNATVTVLIGGRRMEIEGLVSGHVSEPILGIDWLVGNDAVWRFREGTLEIRGRKFNLVARKHDITWARCVSVIDNTATTDGAASVGIGAGQGHAGPPSRVQKSKNARRKEKRRQKFREVKRCGGEQGATKQANGIIAAKQVVHGSMVGWSRKVTSLKSRPSVSSRW